MTIALADAAALAETIAPPTRAVIGGRSVEAASGRPFTSLTPATGQPFAEVAECDAEDVDRAVAAARTAFEDGPWGRLAPADRKLLLLRFASLVEAHTDELAVMESLEAGKPISDCAGVDLPDLVMTMRWHAEACDKIYDQLSPSGSGFVGMVVREPIGVVGAVLPWNYPLMMAGWKIGPILAAGNTCIVKPAEQPSTTTLRIAELAIAAGIPKLRIEEAAARTQARSDSGRQTVVGVNRYRPDEADVVDVRRIDNARVRADQVARLERLRAERDPAACEEALAALTRCADTGEGNLLGLAVDAVRARATVGEVSDALEQVWGRHVAEVRTISGVFNSEVGEDGQVADTRARVAGFEAAHGRRPRILVAKVGQDGHDRGQKGIATAFADLGCDVDIGPLFSTPGEVARQAVENDVHVVGVSSLAAGHLTLVPELRDALAGLGRPDIAIAVGGVIPAQDHDALRAAGAAAIFPPGTVIAAAATELLEQIS